MPKLIILGSASPLSDEAHESTHMVLQGEMDTILIDCVNNPLWRLQKVGIDFNRLTGLLVTHFHPDHVSGVPTLLVNMWLLGRTAPLNIYGLEHTLESVESLMFAYQLKSLDHFYPIFLRPVAEREQASVFESDEFRITASPVCHFLPTIGLRIESLQSKKVLAYSCDTEPCPRVVGLAQDVDVLIHEAGGPGPGHSSAAQAGAIARQAAARRLYLIHYRAWGFDPLPLVAQAQQEYSGPVALAEDFLEIVF